MSESIVEKLGKNIATNSALNSPQVKNVADQLSRIIFGKAFTFLTDREKDYVQMAALSVATASSGFSGRAAPMESFNNIYSGLLQSGRTGVFGYGGGYGTTNVLGHSPVAMAAASNITGIVNDFIRTNTSSSARTATAGPGVLSGFAGAYLSGRGGLTGADTRQITVSAGGNMQTFVNTFKQAEKKLAMSIQDRERLRTETTQAALVDFISRSMDAINGFRGIEHNKNQMNALRSTITEVLNGADTSFINGLKQAGYNDSEIDVAMRQLKNNNNVDDIIKNASKWINGKGSITNITSDFGKELNEALLEASASLKILSDTFNTDNFKELEDVAKQFGIKALANAKQVKSMQSIVLSAKAHARVSGISVQEAMEEMQGFSPVAKAIYGKSEVPASFYGRATMYSNMYRANEKFTGVTVEEGMAKFAANEQNAQNYFNRAIKVFDILKDDPQSKYWLSKLQSGTLTAPEYDNMMRVASNLISANQINEATINNAALPSYIDTDKALAAMRNTVHRNQTAFDINPDSITGQLLFGQNSTANTFAKNSNINTRQFIDTLAATATKLFGNDIASFNNWAGGSIRALNSQISNSDERANSIRKVVEDMADKTGLPQTNISELTNWLISASPEEYKAFLELYQKGSSSSQIGVGLYPLEQDRLNKINVAAEEATKRTKAALNGVNVSNSSTSMKLIANAATALSKVKFDENQRERVGAKMELRGIVPHLFHILESNNAIMDLQSGEIDWYDVNKLTSSLTDDEIKALLNADDKQIRKLGLAVSDLKNGNVSGFNLKDDASIFDWLSSQQDNLRRSVSVGDYSVSAYKAISGLKEAENELNALKTKQALAKNEGRTEEVSRLDQEIKKATETVNRYRTAVTGGIDENGNTIPGIENIAHQIKIIEALSGLDIDTFMMLHGDDLKKLAPIVQEEIFNNPGLMSVNKDGVTIASPSNKMSLDTSAAKKQLKLARAFQLDNVSGVNLNTITEQLQSPDASTRKAAADALNADATIKGITAIFNKEGIAISDKNNLIDANTGALLAEGYNANALVKALSAKGYTTERIAAVLNAELNGNKSFNTALNKKIASGAGPVASDLKTGAWWSWTGFLPWNDNDKTFLYELGKELYSGDLQKAGAFKGKNDEVEDYMEAVKKFNIASGGVLKDGKTTHVVELGDKEFNLADESQRKEALDYLAAKQKEAGLGDFVASMEALTRTKLRLDDKLKFGSLSSGDREVTRDQLENANRLLAVMQYHYVAKNKKGTDKDMEAKQKALLIQTGNITADPMDNISSSGTADGGAAAAVKQLYKFFTGLYEGGALRVREV